MFFEQCDKHFVRQRSGLAQLRVGSDRDPLLVDTWIEVYLLRPSRCAFLVMTEKRAGDPEQIVFHVELAGPCVCLRSLAADRSFGHSLIICGVAACDGRGGGEKLFIRSAMRWRFPPPRLLIFVQLARRVIECVRARSLVR